MVPARMDQPDFTHEETLRARGLRAIAGVDEAGRGPLAGPVVAAAVILDPNYIPDGLRDSKQLTARRRETLCAQLMTCATCSTGLATVAEIDAINILQASFLAMRRALTGLSTVPDFALIDGNRLPTGLNLPALPLVRGDARCLSIAAASIVAKVTRDRIMEQLAAEHPGYGWETNAGYPTRAHKAALQSLGVTPHHRRSFAPVHKML